MDLGKWLRPLRFTALAEYPFVFSYSYLFTILAFGLTFYAFLPYIVSLQKGTIKPHVFSWVIWGITTFIVFFAQLKDGGGMGAWPIGVSGLITLLVAFLAYWKKSDVSIHPSDWFLFLLALTGIPLWYWTSDPLAAVVILTLVDLFGFFPTFRKSYHLPYSERLDMYVIVLIRNACAAIALENYSFTTLLFPVAVGMASALFVLMVIWRRRVIPMPDAF